VESYTKLYMFSQWVNISVSAACGPKHGNFSATDQGVLEFVLEQHKYGLCVRMKSFEVATVLKIP
jgi:hypothetical protein